jgi:hypothetical protein
MAKKFGASGGLGGAAFDAPAPDDGGPWRISAVEVKSGSRIDGIELNMDQSIWSNAIVSGIW